MVTRSKSILIIIFILASLSIWSLISTKKLKISRENFDLHPIAKLIMDGRLSSNSDDLRSTQHRSESCVNGPKKNILYLKTHKTGSSTLQSILARKAYKDNLFAGILKQSVSEIGKKFNRTDLLPIPPNRTLNMIFKEIIFDHEEVSAVMPPDTVYITTIREPASHFESSFHYLYRRVLAYQRAKTEDPKIDYLTHGKEYYKGISDKGPQLYWWFGKNPLFFELGYDNVNEEDEYIQNSIAELDKNFDLVIMMEYFDISIILLKDILCWDMEDFLFVTLNSRNPTTIEKISPDLSEKVYTWNKADAALYKHFNNTFWKRVEIYGKTRMEKNLVRFREMKQKLFDSCYENETVIHDRGYDVKYKPVSMAHYKIKKQQRKNRTCTDMKNEGWDWYLRFKKMQYS